MLECWCSVPDIEGADASPWCWDADAQSLRPLPEVIFYVALGTLLSGLRAAAPKRKGGVWAASTVAIE